MARQPRCILVEDQVLIAMALEASLEEAGFEVAGTFTTSTGALRWLGHNTPELALVDVVLQDGPALPIARELRRRGVPFAIYSGLAPEPHAPEFQDVPWLEKPVSREALSRVLADLAATVSMRPQPARESAPYN